MPPSHLLPKRYANPLEISAPPHFGLVNLQPSQTAAKVYSRFGYHTEDPSGWSNGKSGALLRSKSGTAPATVSGEVLALLPLCL